MSSSTPIRVPRRQTNGGTPLQRTPVARRPASSQVLHSAPRSHRGGGIASMRGSTTTTTTTPLRSIRPYDLNAGALFSPKPLAASAPSLNEQGEEAIQVAVRVRPLNAKEPSNSRHAWKVVKGQPRIELSSVDGSDLPKTRDQFDFDKTFGEDATTRDVYDGSVLNIVKSVCAGLNGTVFAYGQTSSGKTFTMQGSGTIQQGSDGNTSPGIIHMAADDIFGHIESQPNRLFVVTASFLEVYNEDVRDLLSDDAGTGTGGTKSLPVREDKKGRGFFVNCKEEPVAGKESLLSILARGEKSRSFAATAMNERSSRSHTIMRLTIESRSKPTESAEDGIDAEEESVIASTLTLVDLAGSESVRHTGATGDRQTEGANINKSLLSLTLVMKALGDPKTMHVNYRDSNLTRILQPSLSGNARMAIVFCVSPSELYLEETRSTLKFATRAKKVKTRPKVNKIVDDKSKIKALERELEAAKLELVSAGAANVKDLERQVAMSSKEAVVSKEKVGRLTSIILNLNHGIFKTNTGDQKSLTTVVTSKRRLSAGGTPSGTATDECHGKISGPATVPRPDKRRKDAPSNPLPHALQLNLYQEALASKSNSLEAERAKVQQVEDALHAATMRAEGVETELRASKAEVSHLSTQLTSLRPVLEKAFLDQQADQLKLQELQTKYDAEAKERQVLQQSLDEARKTADELKLRNAELSTSLDQTTGRFESDMTQLTGQLASLRQTHETTQQELETHQQELAKCREENQVLRDTNSSLEEAKALCDSQLDDVTSTKISLEEQNKSLQEQRDQEKQASEDENARLEVEVAALSNSKQALEEQCKSLQEEVGTLSDVNKSLERKVQVLEKEKSLLEATICQKDVALEATKLQLEETIQSTSKSVVELELKVAEKNEEVSNVRATLSQRHDELNSLKQTLIASEEQCATLSAERDSITAELEDSSAKLTRAFEVNEEQQTLIESLRSSIAALESKESSTSACLQTTMKERDDAISSLALVQSEVEQILREQEEGRIECESLRQRLVSAEEQHAQLTSDYMSVQECLTSNQVSLENTTQAMLSHQNTCETLRTQVSMLTKENDRVRGEHSQCLATLDELKADEACRLRSEQEEKERVRAQHTEQLEAVQIRLSEVSDELEHSQNALASLRLEFDNLIQQNGAMQSSIHEGTEKEAALTRKLDELQQSYDSTTKEVYRLQSEAVHNAALFDGADKERSALLVDVQSLKSSMEEMTKTVTHLQNQISTLHRELEQAHSAAQNDRQALLDQAHRLETADEYRAALQAELDKMVEVNEASSVQVAVVQAELDRVNPSWESTNKLLEEAKQQITHLEMLESAASQRVAFFEDLAQRLQTDIDDQVTRSQSLADALTKSKSLIVELTAKLGELEREKTDSLHLVPQLQAQIQQATAEAEQVKSALNESRVECDGLKHELVKSHDMLETANDQLKEKQASINELEDQIASMRNMLNERQSPVDKNKSILQTHGEDGNEFGAAETKGNDLANEYELKLLLARANDTILLARQREIQYVRDLEALQAQYESAKAELEQGAIASCASGDIEKLLLENQELEERLQREAANRAATVAEMEHRFLDDKRVLIQQAESTMRNLQTELRKTKESAKQLEAEAYAGRQENQDIRERSSSALARVTELEIENQQLQAAVDEAVKKQTSESMRLSLEARAAKETEYSTKQAVRDLEQKLRDSLDANIKLSMEAKECKLLRVNIKSLQTELEALTNGGCGRDEAIAHLRDELRVKDERIIKLEKLKFTKEQAAQLKKLKESTTRTKKENEQLRQQYESLLASAGESSDITKLRFDKDAIETKFRRVASRCQELEEEKEVCLNVLRRHLPGVEDVNLVSSVATVCDRLTSDVKSSSHYDGLGKEKSQLEMTVEKQKAELHSLSATMASLQNELVQRKKAPESDSDTMELQQKVHFLEQENLNLINEKKLLKTKYHQASKELNRMRMGGADDTTMDLQMLKKQHESFKRHNVSSEECQPISKRTKCQDPLRSSKAQTPVKLNTPAKSKVSKSQLSAEPNRRRVELHNQTPGTARKLKGTTPANWHGVSNDENAGNRSAYTLDNVSESTRKVRENTGRSALDGVDQGSSDRRGQPSSFPPKLGESHPETETGDAPPQCSQS